MQDADLCEDIELGKLVGFFVGAVRVAQGSFCEVLATCVFVIVVEADAGQWEVFWSMGG